MFHVPLRLGAGAQGQHSSPEALLRVPAPEQDGQSRVNGKSPVASVPWGDPGVMGSRWNMEYCASSACCYEDRLVCQLALPVERGIFCL